MTATYPHIIGAIALGTFVLVSWMLLILTLLDGVRPRDMPWHTRIFVTFLFTSVILGLATLVLSFMYFVNPSGSL